MSDAFIDEYSMIHGPVMMAIIRAVERENVRRILTDSHLDRIRHFEGRIETLGLSPADYLIVALNVDDANGAALADVLMPGYDWSAIRASGAVPFAHGLTSRPALQDALTGDAAAELAAIDGAAVLVMDRGIVAAFAVSDLQDGSPAPARTDPTPP